MTDQPVSPSSPASNETPFTVMVRLLRAQFMKAVRENWESVSVDLEVFPPLLRLLVRVGYASLLFMLVATLFHEFLGDFLPQAEGTFNTIRTEMPLASGEVPFTVMGIGAIAYVLGWTYLFTGATGTSRRLFIPLWLFYLWTAANMMTTNWHGILILLPLVAGVGYSATSARPFWRTYSPLEFAMWLGVTGIPMLVFLLTSDSNQIATNLDRLFIGRLNLKTFVGGLGLYYITLPYWLWLGTEAVTGVADISKPVVRTLRQAITDKYLGWLTVPILFVLLIIQLILFFNNFVLYTFMLAGLLLIGIALVLGVIRRLTSRAALILLWLGVTSAVYHVLLGFIIYDSDPSEAIVRSLIPPAFLFMFLMFMDVLTFGKRFTQTDSPRFPRPARLMLYFGVTLLFAATTLFRLNVTITETTLEVFSIAEVFTDIVTAGFLLLGPIALLWLTWRERKELFAEAA